MAMSVRDELASRIEAEAEGSAGVLLDWLAGGAKVKQHMAALRDLAELYRVAREIRGAGEVAPVRRVGRPRKDGS